MPKRVQYIEACDLLIRTLEERFDQQQSVAPVLALENLLFKACNQEPHEDHRDDLDFSLLHRQLLFCADVVKQASPTVKQVTSVHTICEAMNSSSTYKTMLSEVHKLLRLYLTIPITLATSEHSFSALRRVLTYLQSTMTEQRLNHCLPIHIHKHIPDSLDLKTIAREFITAKTERESHFEM